MPDRTAIFKCSFGGRDGWGHAIRSSALARRFLNDGWRTLLWTDSDASTLPGEVAKSFSGTGRALAELDPHRRAEVLVVDEMYTPDEVLERIGEEWRKGDPQRKMVGVDDMRKRRMRAFDLVINTEIGLRGAEYEVPQALLGERYALLRQGFSAGSQPRNPEKESRKVFVMLGGTDAFGYTVRVLEALQRFNSKLSPIVVVGQAAADEAKISKTLSQFEFHRVLKGADSFSLAEALRESAFGVIACGTSLYELAAMQVPFVGLCLVDNQRLSGLKARDNWGMPVVFRDGNHSAPLELEADFERLMRRPPEPYAGVDGFGAARVCDAIFEML